MKNICSFFKKQEREKTGRERAERRSKTATSLILNAEHWSLEIMFYVPRRKLCDECAHTAAICSGAGLWVPGPRAGSALSTTGTGKWLSLFATLSCVQAFASRKEGRNGPWSFMCLEKNRNIIREITDHAMGRLQQRRGLWPGWPTAYKKQRRPVGTTEPQPQRTGTIWPSVEKQKPYRKRKRFCKSQSSMFSPILNEFRGVFFGLAQRRSAHKQQGELANSSCPKAGASLWTGYQDRQLLSQRATAVRPEMGVPGPVGAGCGGVFPSQQWTHLTRGLELIWCSWDRTHPFLRGTRTLTGSSTLIRTLCSQ